MNRRKPLKFIAPLALLAWQPLWMAPPAVAADTSSPSSTGSSTPASPTSPSSGGTDAAQPAAGAPFDPGANAASSATPSTDPPATGTPADGTPAPGTPTPGTPTPAPPVTGAPDPGTPATGNSDAGAPVTGTPAPGTPDIGTPAPGAPGIPGLGPIPTPAASNTVVDIQFNGLRHLSKDLFSSAIQTKVGAPISQKVIEQDAQAIYDRGYFYNVRPRIEQGPNGATVIFELVENPYITSIEVTGNKAIPTNTILGLMLTKPNQVLNTQLRHQDLLKIEDYYASKGYIYARVLDARTDAATGVLHIVIGEGIVEKIKVEGNKKTKPYVIFRAIKTKPGDVFNQKQWQDDLKAIARLNIFNDLHYTQAPGSEPGKIILILNVTEQRTGTVNFGFGYNTRERGVVFLDLADTNFRGRAESVDAQLELGGYRTRGSYQFSFYEPWLGASNYSAGANIYKRQTDRIVPGSNGNNVNGRYFETRTGGGVTLGRRLNETRQLLLNLKNESIASDQIYATIGTIAGGSLTSSSSNVSPFLLQGGNITSAALTGINDTRDLALNPRSGDFDTVILEPGRGSFNNPGDTQSHKFSYLRLSADLRKYFPVGAIKHKEGIDVQKVLAMHLLYGKSSPGVPAFQYFFLGGADTLRGYQEDNFYGENLFLYSLEFRVPIALNKLQLVSFLDTGDAWGGNYTTNKGFRLYEAVGLGVRVVIPQIGPLRLDYGIGKYGGHTHFSIGQTF